MTATSAGLPRRLAAEVEENDAVGGTNRRLRLRVGPDWPASQPGQFVMLSPGATGSTVRFDPLLPRPMAIYRSGVGASTDAIDVLYKVTGRGTALLAEARPGQQVSVVGPLGRGFPLSDPGAGAVLVGGGTGIASLFDLALAAAGRGPVRVLLGARSADDLMGEADFRSIGVELSIATEDGSAGQRGRVTELLETALRELPGATVYACGPTPMMQRAAEIAGETCVVSLENRMACGFGVCLGCAVPRQDGGFALVCRDGPVFGAGDISWKGLP